MKNSLVSPVISLIIWTLLISAITSCKKESAGNFPRSYDFSSISNEEEQLFVLSSPTTATTIPITTGTWGEYREELHADVEDFLSNNFRVEEITLLDEEKIRLRLNIDDVEFDTVVNYTVDAGEILIDGLSGLGSDLLTHNPDQDQFELCGYLAAAFPGPNVISPGSYYNQSIFNNCLTDHTIEDYLNLMLAEDDYKVLDTIGIFVTRFIYK